MGLLPKWQLREEKTLFELTPIRGLPPNTATDFLDCEPRKKMSNSEDDFQYAEDCPYGKSGAASPDKWLDKTVDQIDKFGGDVIAHAFGSESRSGLSRWVQNDDGAPQCVLDARVAAEPEVASV